MRTALDTNVISALWSSEPLATGISTALVQAVRGCFQVAADRGHGAEDMAAVVTAFPTNPA